MLSIYTGGMGHGKTSEVVKNVILPALKKGRSIVTNIDGIKEDLIITYLIEEGFNEDDLGSIKLVTNDDIKSREFYPSSSEDKNAIVKPGDLVVIDEAWQFYPTHNRTSILVKTFIRMHRHYVGEDKKVSDIVLLTQDIKDIHKDWINVVDYTYVMNNLASLGMKSRYRVDVYLKAVLSNKNLLRSYQEKFESYIFEFYKSNEIDGASENETDSRSNIFNGKKIYVYIIIIIAVSILSITTLLSFFFREPELDVAKKEEVKKIVVEEKKGEIIISNSPKDRNKNTLVKKPIEKDKIILSTIWRVAGDTEHNGNKYIILINKEGSFRRLPFSQYRRDLYDEGNNINGQAISKYSGDMKEEFGLSRKNRNLIK